MGEVFEPPLLNIGETIGHFEITDYLGAGGMGEVYQATDGKLGRSVAIKVLHPGASDEEAQRFAREAKAAAALQHPNIVTVHEVGQEQHPHGVLRYLVMEYINGASLRNQLSPQVDVRRVLGWILQVAEGLAAAHRARVVHRDLKPENIMITADGQAKIVDFGLAMYVVPANAMGGQASPHLTKRGQLLGTYHYMSPEQARAEPVDHRSDIFSFGVILFEAIEGRQPFLGANIAELLREIRTADPDISATGLVRDIITSCLRKNPAERYQNAREIARDLRLVVDGSPSRDAQKTQPGPIPSAGRAHPVDACIPAAAAMAVPDTPPDVSLRADLRSKLKRAERLYARDQVQDAHALMDEVYDVARDRGMKREQLEVVLNRGFIVSERHGTDFVKRQLHEAEKLVRDVTSSWHRIEYYRLKAKVLREKNVAQAEKALRKAIALSDVGDDDVRHVGILARCDYVHMLCNEKRLDEAEEHVMLVEPLLRDAELASIELLVPIVEACIHWAIARADFARVLELIDTAVDVSARGESALAFAHALLRCANGARGMRSVDAATACADAAERLGHRGNRPDLALAAAYTAAGALAEHGEFVAARDRCLRLVDVAKGVNEPKLKLCVMQLLSMTSRHLGDKSTAVDAAEVALREAAGDAFGVCLAKMALAEALRDCGRAAEALSHARDVLGLSTVSEMPPDWVEETLVVLSDCCARIGDFDAAERYVKDLKALMGAKPHSRDRVALVENKIKMHKMLRESLTSVTRASEPLVVARTTGATSVQMANAQLVQGLMNAWREYPRAAAALYDYWGRGNLLRAMLNMQAFPGTLNMTIEVHTVEEARQAVRLWALLADVIILLWKGRTISSKVVCPVPQTFDIPGGNGYTAALIAGRPSQPLELSGRALWKSQPTESGTFIITTPYASLLPDDLASFLVGEASALVARGRLLVVPSTGVCCIGTGHGPVESLFAAACNAIPVVRGESPSLPTSWVPFFPDISLSVLAEIAEDQEHATRRLRSLLIRKSREFRGTGETGTEAKELELSLQDAVAHFADAHTGLRRKHGWNATKEAMAATYDGVTEEDVAPILLLKSMGYRWRVESATGVASEATSRLPATNEPVGTWLSPADSKPNFFRPELKMKQKRRRHRR